MLKAERTMGAPLQLGLIRLSDLPDGDGFHRSWVQILPEGHYDHPDFGDIDLTRPVLSDLIRNFRERARGIDIALDYDHQARKGDSKAPGWIEDLEYRPALGETPAGLWAKVRWTELGLDDVKKQIYRYLSAEFHPTYHNDITGKDYKNVLMGLTLTNRPFMKNMPAIALSQRSKFERPGHYTAKDRKKIADADFAGPGRTFPIVTQQDVHDAARLIGHAANPAAVKARITAIAKRKGFALPQEWEAETGKTGDTGESGGGMGMADLNDMSLYEDEAESAAYELADSKKQAKGKIINKNKPDDDNEDDAGMEYDDADDDAAAMDDGDSDGEDYAESDADGDDDDIDHLPARQKNAAKVKAKGGSKQMSESGAYAGLTFDEMAHRLAEMERKVYLSEAEKILMGFESGTFQFSATEARAVSKKTGQPLDGKPVTRSGHFKLAPKAQRAVREWLLSDEAFTLSEGSRREVLRVFETIAAGVVDLSVRGSSHDMERERTVVAKSPSARATGKAAERDVALTEAAAEIAASRGKDMSTLRTLQTRQTREGIEAAQELQQIYALAERQIAAD